MAGTHVTIQVDDRSVRQMLERLVGQATHLAPAMSAIGEALVRNTWQRFEAEKGPGGAPWQPHQAGYAIHRSGGTDRHGRLRLTRPGHQRILTDTGRLQHNVVYQADAHGVTVGTNIEYAAIHQLGGTIRPKNRKYLMFEIDGQIIFAKQVTIPARPFLGIDAADERTIGDIVASFMS